MAVVANRRIRSMRRTLVDLDLLAQSDKPNFMQPQCVSLKRLTVVIYADAAENHPGRLWNLESTASGKAWADPARIADAMHQIVRNAMDHTEPQDPIRVGSTLTDQGNPEPSQEAALARARRLVGLKGYVTNIPATVMGAGEVIGSYHDLWRVEQSFRMSKTDLAARPIFHHRREAIEAHLTIVFTALAVSRQVQTRTRLAIRNVVRQLRPLRCATIAINGTTEIFAPEIPDQQQAILEALGGPELTH